MARLVRNGRSADEVEGYLLVQPEGVEDGDRIHEGQLEAGQARFDGLEPGRYVVTWPRGEGVEPVRKAVDVKVGETTTVDLPADG